MPRPQFCQLCASPLEERLLPAEGRVRLVCNRCGFIHYLNPRVVANALVEREGRVLLLRRAIEPAYGRWTFPGGFLELGESAEAGAERAALEEAGIQVKAEAVLGVYTRAPHGIVAVVFRAELISGLPAAGDEALETAWFAPDAVPWQELAFETTTAALRDWLRATGLRGPPGMAGR